MPGKHKGPVYEKLIDAFNRGEKVLTEPMDYVLLDNLVPEGTLFAGAYPDGPRSKELEKQLFEGLIPANQIATRLRVMSVLGLCIAVGRRGLRSDVVWQITPRGEQYLAKWKEASGGPA